MQKPARMVLQYGKGRRSCSKGVLTFEYIYVQIKKTAMCNTRLVNGFNDYTWLPLFDPDLSSASSQLLQVLETPIKDVRIAAILI